MLMFNESPSHPWRHKSWIHWEKPPDCSAFQTALWSVTSLSLSLRLLVTVNSDDGRTTGRKSSWRKKPLRGEVVRVCDEEKNPVLRQTGLWRVKCTRLKKGELVCQDMRVFFCYAACIKWLVMMIWTIRGLTVISSSAKTINLSFWVGRMAFILSNASRM